MGPGEGHLSLSPVRRSPDLQARSTSFSKSVCKTETGGEDVGQGAVHVAHRMGGGLGLQLPPSPPAGRVQGCACPLLRAKGIHTLSDALCVCVHTCVCSPPRCLRTGHSSLHTWPESLQWDRTRGGPTPEPPAARPPPLIHWGGGQPRVTLSVLTAARGMGKRRPAGPGAAGRGWHTDTEPNALEQWPWFLLQRLPSPDAGGSGKGGPRPCPESSVGRGTQLGPPQAGPWASPGP